MKWLILGGARSGKSRYGEQQALATAKTAFYLATGKAGDNEMAKRIAHHQAQRANSWTVVEEPINLAQTLLALDDPARVILVDCLTLWLSNCLHENGFESQRSALFEILPLLHSDIIFISNEVGSGVVPLGQLSREFVDYSGWLHQKLAKLCDRVTLVVAGLPLHLKESE